MKWPENYYSFGFIVGSAPCHPLFNSKLMAVQIRLKCVCATKLVKTFWYKTECQMHWITNCCIHHRPNTVLGSLHEPPNLSLSFASIAHAKHSTLKIKRPSLCLLSSTVAHVADLHCIVLLYLTCDSHSNCPMFYLFSRVSNFCAGFCGSFVKSFPILEHTHTQTSCSAYIIHGTGTIARIVVVFIKLWPKWRTTWKWANTIYTFWAAHQHIHSHSTFHVWTVKTWLCRCAFVCVLKLQKSTTGLCSFEGSRWKSA